MTARIFERPWSLLDVSLKSGFFLDSTKVDNFVTAHCHWILVGLRDQNKSQPGLHFHILKHNQTWTVTYIGLSTCEMGYFWFCHTIFYWMQWTVNSYNLCLSLCCTNSASDIWPWNLLYCWNLHCSKLTCEIVFYGVLVTQEGVEFAPFGAGVETVISVEWSIGHHGFNK